ncbi:zinc finger BED domain-containing protein 1-like [Aphis craccivora]|uniref:Zinc finger BED domain-containing protein 1-like n=1 Tax=Aphis craccivora TaxID=307492 RepID=A0A6G0XXE4_APHCR|nr:zinc finger BED domain-containing protein 1-like [Aphis craccivora]
MLNDYNNKSMNNEVKSLKKQNIRSKTKKQVKSNKNKTMARKNISYLDNIESLIKNEKIETDIINTITVKQGDNLINVKSSTDEKVPSTGP